MSPELLAHAMKEYVQKLQHQIDTAQAFFFGRLAEGMEGLLQLQLPKCNSKLINGFGIWQEGRRSMRQKASESLISAAILRSVEERMGMDDPID